MASIWQNVYMKNKNLIYGDGNDGNWDGNGAGSASLPRRLRSVAVIVAALALAGCVATPHTTIEGTIAGKPFLVKAPKDGDLTGFDLTADTNGSVHVHIDHLTVKMNPDVIGQTGAAQTALIKATGEAISGAAAATAAGVAQGLKTP